MLIILIVRYLTYFSVKIGTDKKFSNDNKTHIGAVLLESPKV